MHWVYIPRCPVHTACMRQAYVNLVRRVAEGRPRMFDDRRMHETMTALELTPEHFNADLGAARSGKPESSPRLRGEWADLPVYRAREVEDEGIIPIGAQS